MDLSLFSKHDINTSLISSLSYIHSELHKTDELENPFETIANNLSVNWVTYGSYNMLLDTIETNSIASSKRLMDTIFNTITPPVPSTLVSVFDSEYSIGKVELITRELSKHSDKVIKCGELDSESSVYAKAKMEEALDTIHSGSPLLWSLVNTYVDEVVLTGSTNGHYVQSAASFNLFGLVMIYGDTAQDVDFYLEHLIHELAHIILYTVNAKESVVTNEEHERFQAPYREDLRPMDGIYHAYFVMSYIIIHLRALADSGVLNESLVAKVEKRISNTEDKFMKTYKMMLEDAKFTAVGREIFDASYTETMRALRSEGSHV